MTLYMMLVMQMNLISILRKTKLTSEIEDKDKLTLDNLLNFHRKVRMLCGWWIWLLGFSIF